MSNTTTTPTVANILPTIQLISEAANTVLGVADPALEQVVAALSQIAINALQAWSQATNTPITADSIANLLITDSTK